MHCSETATGTAWITKSKALTDKKKKKISNPLEDNERIAVCTAIKFREGGHRKADVSPHG